MSTNRSLLTPLRIVIAGMVILVFAAVWGWFGLKYSSPSATFDRMLSNMLASPSIYKETLQGDDGQQVDQRTQLVTSPQQRAHSIVIVRQGANLGTVITTESIGTPEADYVRHTDIKTDQKTAQGKNFDFSSVLGVWGKSDAGDEASGGAQLYNETVLGVLPIGNLTPNQRRDLLRQIKETGVYSVNFDEVKKSSKNGRAVYEYEVSVKPKAYVATLVQYARDIGLKKIGSRELDVINPDDYATSPPLEFTFDVDVLSGELIKLTYNDSSGRFENYGSYGAHAFIDLPTKTIPVQELETRLQQLQ